MVDQAKKQPLCEFAPAAMRIMSRSQNAVVHCALSHCRSLGRVTAVTAVSLFVPAEFHVLLAAAKDVDARDKRGHDDSI